MDIKKEYMEAINSADKALDTIDYALKKLNSAKKWGVVDIFGGELISSLVKHGKMDDAADAVAMLDRDLNDFQKELLDLDKELGDYQISSFGSKFLDIAFDNIFSDWSNQKKIKKNIKTLKKLQSKITYIRDDLLDELEKLDK